ncbi:MAG: hypothetical protein M3N22_07345 [Acidobacteriota bacterium]|nr:hypothetical protein [Acidobacteriota bacterium]
MCVATALFVGTLFCFGASQVDDQLTARRRVFPSIGAGLRAIHRDANGKYYLLASPSLGVVIFDAKGKQLSSIGGAASTDATASNRASIAFGEDCGTDAQGNIFVADRGLNQVSAFSPDGKFLRSFPVSGPRSLVVLPDGEVAVTTDRSTHLIVVYGTNGKVVREFGDPEEISRRDDLNRYLSIGRLSSDSQNRLYYGFTYFPEPLVRQYDRFGYAGQDFRFTGLDAYPEATAARKEIERQEKKIQPPVFRPILTVFAVDPVNGDVWMCLHNTLLHFDKDGNRLSEYQIYTPGGARLEATTLLVEPDRLLIGSDPLGVFDFERPDRKH